MEKNKELYADESGSTPTNRMRQEEEESSRKNNKN